MAGLDGQIGANINGPSVIRVPEWLPNRLGQYYMYFAHHQGTYIRLAFADSPEGPWTIHGPGVLHLDDTAAQRHIASPDVHVDDERRQLRMYFHGPAVDQAGQRTFVAMSRDGLTFSASPKDLGLPYFRVFKFGNAHYAIAKRGAEAGFLMRSPDGSTPFETGPALIPGMRHAAVYREGDRLVVFYSRLGDAPERILRTSVDLRGDWTTWKAKEPTVALRPEHDYEGIELPIRESEGGIAREPVHELRDPALLVDGDLRYLYYSVAGEQGIAVARFTKPSELRADLPDDSRSRAHLSRKVRL